MVGSEPAELPAEPECDLAGFLTKSTGDLGKDPRWTTSTPRYKMLYSTAAVSTLCTTPKKFLAQLFFAIVSGVGVECGWGQLCGDDQPGWNGTIPPYPIIYFAIWSL